MNGETYVFIERLLFDVDYAIKRMHGWSTRPGCPPETDRALRQAWDLGIDLARVLYDEKQRLVQAKVVQDLGGA